MASSDAPIRAPNPWEARSKADAAMERYAGGDDAALAEVCEELTPRLMAHLFDTNARRSRKEAEDVVVQTMLHVHRARGSYVPGSGVVQWAIAIADRLDDASVRTRRREALVTTAVARVRRAYDTLREALRERGARGAAS